MGLRFSEGARCSLCPAVARVLIELSNVRGRDATELGHATALQILSKCRELLGEFPCRLLGEPAMPPYEVQVRCQNRAEPRWRRRRAANTTAKAPLLICLEKDPDGSPKDAGSAGAATRYAFGHVPPYNLGIGPRQPHTFVCVEAEREAQPLMQVLTYNLARVPQSH